MKYAYNTYFLFLPYVCHSIVFPGFAFFFTLHVMHNELYLIVVFSQDGYVYIKQSRSIGKLGHGIWVADMTHFGIVDMQCDKLNFI